MRDEAISRADHPECAAFADACDMRARDCKEIKRDRERHAVEVSAADDVANTVVACCKHQWIVSHCAEFAFDRAFNKRKCVKRRAQHLRHRAQRIRILHARIVFSMR